MLHRHLQLLTFTDGLVRSSTAKTAKASETTSEATKATSWTITASWCWSLIFNNSLQVACFQYRTHSDFILLEQLRNLIAVLFPVLEVCRTFTILELEWIGQFLNQRELIWLDNWLHLEFFSRIFLLITIRNLCLS